MRRARPPPISSKKDEQAAHHKEALVEDTLRRAAERELVSEMRGLLIAAKMHGFQLSVTPDGVVKMVDLRAATIPYVRE